MPVAPIVWAAIAVSATAATTAAVMANQKKQAAKGKAFALQNAEEKNWDLGTEFRDRAKENYNPYMESGKKANAELSAKIGTDGELGRQFTARDFQASPSYAFDMAEQMKAIQRSQSGRGGAISGGAQKALQDRSSQVANREFTNRENAFKSWQQQNYGQLMGMSQQGLNASNAMTTADANATNMQRGANTAIGVAQAGQYQTIGDANAGAAAGIGEGIQKGIGMVYGGGAGSVGTGANSSLSQYMGQIPGNTNSGGVGDMLTQPNNNLTPSSRLQYDKISS